MRSSRCAVERNVSIHHRKFHSIPVPVRTSFNVSHQPYVSPSNASALGGATGPRIVPQPIWELKLPQGLLIICPIQRSDVQAAGVVLTRAFAGSAEAVSLAEVLKDIDERLQNYCYAPGDAQELPPPSPPLAPLATDGCFLVARLQPSDSSPTQPTDWLPQGQPSRLIGTAAISLTALARPRRVLPSVNQPPADAAYVSDMAVDPRFRRQGVARALLGAAEEVARRAGRREVWLHVREADAAARALYDSAGYVAVGTDSWVDTLRHGMKARVLMRRPL